MDFALCDRQRSVRLWKSKRAKSAQPRPNGEAAPVEEPLKKRAARPTGPLVATNKIGATSFRGVDPPSPTSSGATNPVSKSRIRIVTLGMGLMTVGLLVQLIRVQFGPYAPVFAARGDVGSSRLERVIPARGLIYDRDGRLLAANATSYVLEVETSQLTAASREAIQ